MSLSCDCDFGDESWYYYGPNEYLEMPKYSRRKRCCSCKIFITAGDLCTLFERWTSDEWDNEKELTPWYMCEECSDLYFSLRELGFCIFIGGDNGNMKELVKEYARGDWQ